MVLKPMSEEQRVKLEKIRNRISNSPYFAAVSDIEYTFDERYELCFELAKRILLEIG